MSRYQQRKLLILFFSFLLLHISCKEEETTPEICTDCSEGLFIDSLELQRFRLEKSPVTSSKLIPTIGPYSRYTLCNPSIFDSLESGKLVLTAPLLYERCDPTQLQFPLLAQVSSYELIQTCIQIKDSVDGSNDIFNYWEIIKIVKDQVDFLPPCEMYEIPVIGFVRGTGSNIQINGSTGSNAFGNQAAFAEDVFITELGCTTSDSDPITTDAAVFEDLIYDFICPENSPISFTITKNFITLTNDSKSLKIEAQLHELQ